MRDRCEYSIGRSLLEKVIEGGTGVWGAVFSRNWIQAVWNEEVTKVCSLAISDPFGLRLAALVVGIRVIVRAVQTTANVACALGALIAT